MAKKVNFSKNESNDVKKFIISLVIVALVVGLIYILTGLFVTKDLKKSDDKTTTKAEIDYDLTLIGNIFDLDYDDYYVMVYDFDNDDSTKIESLISNYKTSDNYTKIFKANISDSLNKNFIDKNNSNPNASNIGEIKIKDTTLIHFKNKKIVSYKENYEEIEEELTK